MHSLVSALGAVPHNHGLFILCDPLVKNAVCSAWKLMLIHPTAGSWNAMLFMMKHVPEGISRLEIMARNRDPSTLPSRTTIASARLEAIAAVTKVQNQDRFLSEQKRREPLVAYCGRWIMLLWNAASSIATTKGGLVFQTQSLTWRY